MRAMPTADPSTDTPTIGELLREARSGLATAVFHPEVREASLLLSHVLERREASILAHPEEVVGATAAARFRQYLSRRLRGEPVAYLFGEREFYGRPFRVDPRVLIPRPETEHLIEAVLALGLGERPAIVDVGTGSGCIAVTLSLEIPGARLLATDLSLAALQVARSNLQRHGVEDRVALANADLASALRLQELDLVVSNPPYVDAEDRELLSTEVREFEPHLALFAPGRGYSVLDRLLYQAEDLAAGGHLIVEIGYDQSDWIAAAVEKRPGWTLIEVIKDYGSVPRTAVLRRLARS